jgi:hypothetical protein
VDFQERAGRQGQELTLIHLIKLAVGVRDIAHLHALQKARAAQNPPLRHLTRNFPKRAEELLDGGSMYWVITGTILVRQRLVGVERATDSDGTPRTALILDPALVYVEARPMRAFQGWRYLPESDAPADLAVGSASADMPEEMRRQLAALGLL